MVSFIFVANTLACSARKTEVELLREISNATEVHTELKRRHCPQGSRLKRTETSDFCIDRKTGKKQGWELRIDQEGYELSFYKQGELAQFPWLITQQKLPNWQKIVLNIKPLGIS